MFYVGSLVLPRVAVDCQHSFSLNVSTVRSLFSYYEMETCPSNEFNERHPVFFPFLILLRLILLRLGPRRRRQVT